MAPGPRTRTKDAVPGRRAGHHAVYVVYLRNPNGDGRAGYYVGMTGLSPEQRFANHKAGIKAARVVRRYGERLVPRLYAHLNPMTYARAKRMEVLLADSLRKRGYLVFGGH
jgi:predicted GIY-YIG superfamily endonuclease